MPSRQGQLVSIFGPCTGRYFRGCRCLLKLLSVSKTIVRLTVPPTIVQQGTVPVSTEEEFKMVEMCLVKFDALVSCSPRLVDTGNYQLEID